MANAPTFMIIGAARSGTTALYDLVRQHPQVFMSAIKEPNYFAFEGEPLDWEGPGKEFVNNSVARWEDYCALFAPAPDNTARGEASPLYLWSPDAAQRIKARLPDVRMIAVLRNPPIHPGSRQASRAMARVALSTAMISATTPGQPSA